MYVFACLRSEYVKLWNVCVCECGFLFLQACIQCKGLPSNCQTLGSDGAGVANSDFALYVSAIKSRPCFENIVAFAGTCQMESEYDRCVGVSEKSSNIYQYTA